MALFSGRSALVRAVKSMFLNEHWTNSRWLRAGMKSRRRSTCFDPKDPDLIYEVPQWAEDKVYESDGALNPLE